METMKKTITRNVDPFHDEIEIVGDMVIDFDTYPDLNNVSKITIDLTEESSKLDENCEIAINKGENNLKSIITQDLSKEKIKNIPHEARYSIQLEKTKALNAQHGSIFLKSPKDDHRCDLPFKMNTPRSSTENIPEPDKSLKTSSETINEEKLKILKVDNVCQPDFKMKMPKNIKCRNSRKNSSSRSFSKYKNLSLKKNNTKSSKKFSKLALRINDVIEDIGAALFNSEAFINKIKNLVSVTTENSNKLLEKQNIDSKPICDSNSNENNLKKSGNADSTNYTVKIYKTRQPEAIIHELIESIKERYAHHTNLPDKFIFPIIYDEPANIIHKYEFLTYETYLKTSISSDPNYKTIYSDRTLTQSNCEKPPTILNSGQNDKAFNKNDDDIDDDDENCLVINEEIVNENLSTKEDTSLKSSHDILQNFNNNISQPETFLNQSLNQLIPNRNLENPESTIDRISVNESQNRKTPQVNIILKAPNNLEKNVSNLTMPVNLCSNVCRKSKISSSSKHKKIAKKVDQSNTNEIIRSRCNQNDIILNSNSLRRKRPYTNLIASSNVYNVHNKHLQNSSNYMESENCSLQRSMNNKQPIMRNSYSTNIEEQIQPHLVQRNHLQQPVNLILEPPRINDNGHGLIFKHQNAQSNISTSHPQYPLIPNTDARILENRLQQSPPPYQLPSILTIQSKNNKNFDSSANYLPQQQLNQSISQYPNIYSNTYKKGRMPNDNEVIQYQPNSIYYLAPQLNYQSHANGLPNNKQHTIIDKNPGVANNQHSQALQNHVYQQNYYYGVKEPQIINYNNQNYQEQFLPHSSNKLSTAETHSQKSNIK